MVTGNSINANSTGLVRYNGSGTFDAQTTTNHAVLVGATSNGITNLSVGATGTVLAGSTGADPSFTATPSVTSITLGGGTALGNYLQGTFTPGLSFGGGTTGITYNNQTGIYVRIGRVIYFNFTLGITSKGSSTGAANLTGLPVAVSGSGQFTSIFNGGGITYPATYLQLGINFNDGATSATINAFTSVSGTGGMADTNFANTTTFFGSGFYFV